MIYKKAGYSRRAPRCLCQLQVKDGAEHVAKIRTYFELPNKKVKK